MKKIISLLLIVAMVCSLGVTAFATTNYTNGTQVQYNGELDNDGDGQPDATEYYTVTVPALLAPGESGDVLAQGTWASNRTLVVDADDTVTLTNSINANDQKVLDITFAGIELAGSNTVAVSETEAVGVADIEDALFGTWSGTFYYDVELVNSITGGDSGNTGEPAPDGYAYYNGHLLPYPVVTASESEPFLFLWTDGTYFYFSECELGGYDQYVYVRHDTTNGGYYWMRGQITPTRKCDSVSILQFFQANLTGNHYSYRGDEILWTNIDLYYADTGELFMAGSEPTFVS